MKGMRVQRRRGASLVMSHCSLTTSVTASANHKHSTTQRHCKQPFNSFNVSAFINLKDK